VLAATPSPLVVAGADGLAAWFADAAVADGAFADGAFADGAFPLGGNALAALASATESRVGAGPARRGAAGLGGEPVAGGDEAVDAVSGDFAESLEEPAGRDGADAADAANGADAAEAAGEVDCADRTVGANGSHGMTAPSRIAKSCQISRRLNHWDLSLRARRRAVIPTPFSLAGASIRGWVLASPSRGGKVISRTAHDIKTA
jgi:hypothetical protein